MGNNEDYRIIGGIFIERRIDGDNLDTTVNEWIQQEDKEGSMGDEN